MLDYPDAPPCIYHGEKLREHRRMAGTGVFFVTKCIHPRVPLLTQKEGGHAPADIIVDAICHKAQAKSMRLAAFCVMPDHWHALFAPNVESQDECLSHPVAGSLRTGQLPASGLSQTMLRLDTWIARRTNPFLRRHAVAWQRGYYETRIRSGKQFHFVCSYIEHNPVRAEIAKAPEHWPWSSAHDAFKDIILRPWPTPIT